VSPRVVYTSSAAIYGDSGATPLTEMALPRPINAYGADKLGCELHGRVATVLHGIPTIGLRLFNVFGPRQDPSSPYSGVISIFMDRLRRDGAIDIFGDGGQVRDFIAVADVVEFFLAAMAAPQGVGEAFNACTGQVTTVLTLAETIASVLGVTPAIRFGAPRAGDIRTSIGNPDRAARILGCTARLSLREGLARIVETADTPPG
jgi:UDP-glucose 4-epimerase